MVILRLLSRSSASKHGATSTDTYEETVMGVQCHLTAKEVFLQSLLPSGGSQRSSSAQPKRKMENEILLPHLILLRRHPELFKTILQEIPYTYSRIK